MASREFLKIMKNARLGDAFSQHRLGEIYLNGEFDTPKQAANALIWFEKAYRSYKTQNVTESISSIIEAVQKISLTEILSSPSAEFAWECFSNAAKNNNMALPLHICWYQNILINFFQTQIFVNKQS